MKKPSIDRIDSNGNYELSNCRFLELSENVKRELIGRLPYNIIPTIQFSKEGNIIEKFISIRIASDKTKINPHNISSVIRGERKTAGGFIWKRG